MRKARVLTIALAALAVVVVGTTVGEAGVSRISGPANNTPPTISGTAQQGQALTASSGSWSGSGTITFAFSWQRCSPGCGAISGATAQTYVLTAADIGATIAVKVTATDSTGSSTQTSAQTAPVAAANAPTNSSPPTISGTARASQPLTASAGTWTGTQPIAYAYQWSRCNTVGASCATIGGANGQTYTLSSADVGHTVRVLVTATNSAGAASALSTQSAVVAAQGSAPAAKSAPVITGTPAVNQTLKTSTGSWNGTAPFAYKYAWQRCDSKGNHCETIGGADGNSYNVRSEDVAHTLRSAVTATNVAGTSTAVSKQTGLVQGKPALVKPPAISGSAQIGQKLTASAGSWASATKVTIYYQWVRCDANGKSCAPVPNAGAAAYTVTNADAGHRLFVQVKAHNASGDSFANSAQTGVVGSTSAAGGAVPVAGLTLPARLTVSKVSFSPSRITSHVKPLVVRARITTTDGKPVSGALVYVVGVPFNRISPAKEVATDGNGWATLSFSVKPTLTLRRGNLLVLFVRARKPGGSTLAGISTRRLVSVRIG